MFDPTSVMRDLQDSNVSVWLEASKLLEKEARKVTNSRREKWFGNRNATAPIVAALDDPDPRVAQNAVIAIAEITRRYFKDDRAYAGILRLLTSKDQLTRQWAASAALDLRGDESLIVVLPLFKDRSKKVRLNVFRTVCRILMHMRDEELGVLQSSNREAVQEAAIAALSDSDHEVRTSASTILREIGDANALPALQAALAREDNTNTKDVFGVAIEWIRGRL